MTNKKRKSGCECWRPATAAASLHCHSPGVAAHQASGFAVQSLLDLLFGLLGESPDDRPAELAERRDRLVWGHFLHNHEQRRGPRLELPADLVDELLVDTGLLNLAEEPSEGLRRPLYPGSVRRTDSRRAAPRTIPTPPSPDRVMIGSGLILPVLVAYDCRNFIGLDHELRLELVDLVHGRRSRGGIRICDRDQVGHQDPR